MKNKKRGNKFIFSGKKGQDSEIFFNLFELILAVIVFWALLKFIYGVGQQTTFEKNYLSRDFALLVNTVYSAPGDISYIYSENAPKESLTFNFIPNKVEVYGNDDKNDEQHISYLFAENKKIEFKYKTLTNEPESVKIVLTKTNDYVDVGPTSIVK